VVLDRSHAPCDVIEVSNLDHDTAKHIGVSTDEGPFDTAKVGLADALATQSAGRSPSISPSPRTPPESRRNTIEDYFSELEELCKAPVETRIIDSGTHDAIELAAHDSDVLIVSGVQRGLIDLLFSRRNLTTVKNEHGILVVYGESQPGRLHGAVERHLF
jgi:hypothetical protein